ncbi:MAG: UDP-N-acetylmuramoyl-L-alanine--D-glutamate ligase [Candidatus Falkowbacteria bacterium]
MPKTLDDLRDKKICILGLGIENYALVKFLLKKKIRREITICDSRDKKDLKNRYDVIAMSDDDDNEIATPTARNDSVDVARNDSGLRLGKNYDKNLDKFDVIFRSPGYPLFKLNKKNWIAGQARNDKVEISSPMKLFFELCPTKNIIGVTGTKGKGTTASLIYEILKLSKKRIFLGGNIGIAPFEFINKIKKDDWVVLELSSFQLEDMDASPHIAVITNFSREHLAPADPNNPNYHKSMRGYWEAKANIFRWQKTNDYFIINKNFQFSIFNFQSISNVSIFNFQKLYKKNYKSNPIFFTSSDLPSRLIGEHNKENIAAAVEVAKIVGVKNEIIKKAVANFKGLEHRLEFVKEIKNIKYYNDSFATIPESTITALKSFSNNIILLAGGAEKKSDFKKLAREIKKRVKFIILLNGKATPRLKKEILKAGYNKDGIKLVYNIKDAVKIAKQNAEKGDVVLLSPACASFGMFKNYKERGEKFKKEII